MRNRTAEAARCLDEASYAMKLACAEPMLRNQFLKVAEELTIRAHRMEMAKELGGRVYEGDPLRTIH